LRRNIVKKLLALAGLVSVLALPSLALAEETQCTASQLDETIVANCSPIADVDGYYYAGPDLDYVMASVPADQPAGPNDGAPGMLASTAFATIALAAGLGGA
jgi:hypothetical protein